MSTRIDFQTLLTTVESATGVEPTEEDAGGTIVLLVNLPDGRLLTIGDRPERMVVEQDDTQGPLFVDVDGFTVQSYPDRGAYEDGAHWTEVAEIAPSLPLLEAVLRATAAPGATPGPRAKRLRVTLEVLVPATVSDEDLEAVANAAHVQVAEPHDLDDRALPTLSAASVSTSIDFVDAP